MKKLALLGLLTLLNSASYATDAQMFYAGGGVIQGESTGLGVKGTFGFKPIPYVGAEISRSFGVSSDDVSGILSYNLVGFLPIEKRFNLIAKAGHAKVWGSNYDTSDEAKGLLLGLGAEYNFKKASVLRFEYENYPSPDYTNDERGGIFTLSFLGRF